MSERSFEIDDNISLEWYEVILDNLMNIHDEMLDLLDQIDPKDIDPNEPVVISWNYTDCPMRFTLLIHENLPEEVDYLESEVIH